MTASLEHHPGEADPACTGSSKDGSSPSQYFELTPDGVFQLKNTEKNRVIVRVASQVAMRGLSILREHERNWREPKKHIPGALVETFDEEGKLVTVGSKSAELLLATLSIHTELGKELTSDERGAATTVAQDLHIFLNELGANTSQS